MRITLLVLIGLPGSGKSTFADFVSQSKEIQNVYDVIVITFDKYVIYDENNFSKWKESRDRLQVMIKDLIIKIRTNNSDKSSNLIIDWTKLTGKDIVIILDDNMYYKSMRYKFFQVAKEEEIQFVQLYFCKTVDECIKLNSLRTSDQKVPSTIILEMSSKLEAPTFESWESNSYICDTLKYSDSFFLNLMQQSNEYKMPTFNVYFESVESKDLNSKNLVHQLDILSRQVTGESIKSYIGSKDEKIKFARIQNEKRKGFVSKVKTGAIVLPQDVYKDNEIDKDFLKTLVVSFLGTMK